MELATAVNLIRKGIDSDRAQQWADLGAGKGLFTRTLLQLLPANSMVDAIDHDHAALLKLKTELDTPQVTIIHADFTTVSLRENHYDGILMANAIHFTKDKVALLRKINTSLKKDGRILFIEYDMEQGNQWVPFPLSFRQLGELALQCELRTPVFLHSVPSRYNGAGIYAALLKL
jgi:ubiquinone/menaquinone biosynthesis C-methylase UbiE